MNAKLTIYVHSCLCSVCGFMSAAEGLIDEFVFGLIWSLCLDVVLWMVLQLEEWEQEPSSCQLAILEALKEVLGSLLRELSRATKLDM